MSALIFLLAGASMVAGILARRPAALVLFVVAILFAAGWFDHHVTDALALDF